LEEETKSAFVKQVESIGRDQIYWVRREASFALGALAKIVPEEVIICSLVCLFRRILFCHFRSIMYAVHLQLPVFESLRIDSVWQVRHSALFALPAILSRLTPHQRRSLAIDTVVPLSVDESASVRLGVLEALGEIIHTFHEDTHGPPDEILRLFLGRAEDRRVRDERQSSPPSISDQFAKQQVWGTPKSPFTSQIQDLDTLGSPMEAESPLESFYKDPGRPLICAFNYPAVALTLGRARWDELRELYLALSQDPALKVRRTLAASLGELAKIIGPDNAQQDLLPVWWDDIKCEEDGEVRLKAIECVGTFVGALGERKVEVAEGLLSVWKAGTLKGWREKQVAVGALVGFIGSIGELKPSVIKGLLKVALEDGAVGVREAAISIVSANICLRANSILS
jgi:serine/threonine-protein phosphatase 4 regulatory subunit 1